MKTSNLLPNANYHCLCFVRNILNIPHLEQKDRLQLHALHADDKT